MLLEEGIWQKNFKVIHNYKNKVLKKKDTKTYLYCKIQGFLWRNEFLCQLLLELLIKNRA